ncbi:MULTISPECIES: cobyrinate a,c-diamide synthase [unclassified Dysgonomonas]|jgi:cobyrinic acid a,c-diamide synthase|uniref:cobyrinate a,c-diamide synthase n=1 Tax=unclassified Dysgonomonas TaxID=2630389 RepID=UPI0025C39F00|nr:MULTISPECIES: cobyrinate a,c-diamide synthase [unclassified Dysgonomonas]MDR2001824.1 cobyrinate a,c-diamide synthase [Prevotella sp.]HMM04228.1 cobyrinate a,c-diamide synthase [Dysgonomonas sp.]
MTYTSNFLISAIASGSGKTTVTLGLLRALRNRGLNVQPFKCGPDYIDTKYHVLAAGNESVNLDLFLSSESHIKYLYNKYSSDKDVCITEGVMGLFDGYDRMNGSSAQIAEKLDIPVILVLNAKSMAYSAAALLYGFKNFSDKINITGVIFNFVASESHYNFLKDACHDVGLEPLGYLPKNTDIEIPSRHLGLNIDEQYRFDDFADKAAALIEKYIDIDKLLSITARREPHIGITKEINVPLQGLRISVARDAAFNFMYHENIEYMKRIGIVSYFSPLYDKQLPESDFIYLPGGYPELYLSELSNNRTMQDSIRHYVEAGGKALAECGGMMYLSSSISDENGIEYPMVNIFDQKATMENMRLKLGYRQFEYNGVLLKGHEFHYSSIKSEQQSVVQQYTAKGQPTDTKLLRYKNVIAGYTHLYWADTNNLMDLF